MSSSSSSSLSVSNSSSSDPSSKSVSPDGETQRFFSQGKRIPKDVKRHCGMCKQHGIFVETRGHTCDYKNCECEQCQLVRRRREIMSTQIRLRREQDKKFQRTTDISEANVFPGCTGEADEKSLQENMNMCYFCQKCKNHNVLVWKKNHKKECKFVNCECEQCSLIDSRRALDRHIKKRKMSLKSPEVKPPKSPKKEPLTAFSSLTSSGCNSEESTSSSDCSLSGLLTEKLNVEPSNEEPLNVKFDFSTGSFVTPSAKSPATPQFETASPLLLSNSPVPTLFPQIPTSLSFPLINTTFAPSLMYGARPFLLPNPFLMPLAPIDMQMLFQSIQNLSEMVKKE
uniref:DM domain-containing protein n=1 Tax=Caenorhabditis japonica TaxID=281687 RepID=A0A8R1DRD5_CAEJA